MHMRIIPFYGIYQHKHRKEGRMKLINNMKYWLNAATKITSMPLGNQNGWFDNLNNAPPTIN